MTTQELESLAKAAASRHGLEPAVVCGICERESSWNPWANRYEPAFFARIAGLFTTNKITATEAYNRATSWGLMQVLGQTAREHGFAGMFLTELCDPATGLEIGCEVFAHKLGLEKGDIAEGLLIYNGGGNKNYPAEVLALAEKYK